DRRCFLSLFPFHVTRNRKLTIRDVDGLTALRTEQQQPANLFVQRPLPGWRHVHEPNLPEVATAVLQDRVVANRLEVGGTLFHLGDTPEAIPVDFANYTCTSRKPDHDDECQCSFHCWGHSRAI